MSRDREPGEFSEAKRIALRALVGTEGYEALLDIMERECVIQETAFLRTSIGDRETILGGYAKTTAMRAFFERVQAKVAHELKELSAPNPKVLDDEQVEINNTCDPTIAHE